MAKIIAVEKGSISDELGISAGDELIGFDNKPIEDILDYVFYEGESDFVMNIKSRDGELIDFDIEKDVFERIGLGLDDSVEIEAKRCKNKCLFCFVDQLPEGMRDTLYVKDDDYRLSFISGNFITFTNVSDSEFERIVRLRLSPLYVSVHSADEENKNRLVSNPEGARLIEKLKYLSDNGIKMHTQIVMCKDINDGKDLENTINVLSKIEGVLSVAVVPVGLTMHRQKLFPLQQIDKKTAQETIDFVEKFNEGLGGNFCWCSDEFYIKAEREIPPAEFYGDFSQIENGVGLVAEFFEDLKYALSLKKATNKKSRFSFITGKSFAPFLRRAVEMIRAKFEGFEYNIFDIKNNFFGETITVSGLITSQDIIAQCKGKVYENTVIPDNMLREFTDTFLDGKTVSDIEEALGTTVFISANGADVVNIIGGLK